MEHIFLSFLFYNIILLIIYHNSRKGNKYINKSELIFYTLLFIAFGTFGGGEGDYLHYRDRMAFFQTYADIFSDYGMERQYNYLAYFVKGNYTLWRLVIFSVEFIGMSWMLYKAKLNTYRNLLCFVIICLVLYTYQRSYWGVIFYFLGLYLLLYKKNPLFLIIIASCYFAHTQNVILLALLPLGFIKMKSWHMIVIILFFGVISATVGDAFVSYIDSGGIDGADYISKKLSTYSGRKIAYFGSSIGEVTVFMFKYIPFALIVLYIVKMITSSKNKYSYLSLDCSYRGLANMSIGLFLAALIAMAASLGSGVYFYRILSMGLFPISMLLPYMFESGLISKQSYKFYITIWLIGTELNYFKDLYYAYVGGI